MFYKCFIMFNNVLRSLVRRSAASGRNDRNRRIGDHWQPIVSGIATRSGDNSAEICDNYAEISDDAAGNVNIATKVIPC